MTVQMPAGIPVATLSALPALALNVGANRVVKGVRIEHVCGDPSLAEDADLALGRRIVMAGLRAQTAGTITINVYAARDALHAVLQNPYEPSSDHHQGNHMALANIRERLQLHFDAEAGLTSRVTDHRYEVHIVIPLRREAA